MNDRWCRPVRAGVGRRIDPVDRRERGSAMIIVILMGVVFTALAASLMANSVSESGRSGLAVKRTTALAAAEAGVDDYIAKLTQDHTYFQHYVHPGEATRKDANNVTGAAGTTWTGTTTWTYPNGRDAWRTLENGYEYDLQITPPTAGSGVVTITSTGRKTGSTTDIRRVQAQVRPAAVTDFQMVANADVSYGSSATTKGKIYAGIDSSNIKHNIAHNGVAYGDLYAEGSITASPTYKNGAKGYSSSTIRSVIPSPVNFNTFTTSLVDLNDAAKNGGGLFLDDSTKDGWRLTFNSTGTITVAGCKKNNGNHLAAATPTCTTTQTVNVPSVGAVYANQSVIVMGQVKGRVTVASNADVIIGGNVTYVTPGVDVLGLVAKNEMIVAQWAPTTLTWYSATIAQTGQWRSWSTDGSHDTLNFFGSTATNLGGYMGMFNTRNYTYDQNLLFLQPPYFPVLEDAYTIQFFRELPPS
jgi:Tfp pilus assembly protein PilX